MSDFIIKSRCRVFKWIADLAQTTSFNITDHSLSVKLGCLVSQERASSTAARSLIREIQTRVAYGMIDK